MENELSDLIPGYTAPLTLSAAATINNKNQSSLRTLRKKTVAKESALIRKTTSAKRSFKTGKPQKSSTATNAGAGWFHMPSSDPATMQKDVDLIRNRNYLDPKRFYKTPDAHSTLMQQLGTVVEGPSEFYSSRIARKDRRPTLVEEWLLNDSVYAVNKFKNMSREKAMKRKKSRNKGRR